MIHLDGIGGWGKWNDGKIAEIPQMVPPKGWSVDCIPCGYLRLFAKQGRLIFDEKELSDFEVYAG